MKVSKSHNPPTSPKNRTCSSQVWSLVQLMSVWIFTWSSSVCVGILCVFQFPPTYQKYVGRWSGYSKLPLEVNACVCVRACAWCPVVDRRPFQDVVLSCVQCSRDSVWNEFTTCSHVCEHRWLSQPGQGYCLQSSITNF